MAAAKTSRSQSQPDEQSPAAAPQAGTLAGLRAEARECRACPLWAPATQTVFGEGPERASLLFVGEQPGDQEDLAGRPFVGPAGLLFDRALADAGIARQRAYVTNAVKHFKFVPRGKRRLHQKPTAGEIHACNRWLVLEMARVAPDLVIAMGATAARAVLGRATPVGASRGRLIEPDEARYKALVTVHPSYLLRLPDPAAKEREYERFVDDLRLCRPFLADG